MRRSSVMDDLDDDLDDDDDPMEGWDDEAQRQAHSRKQVIQRIR